jgi:MoaA/NifB/PqqE/SkfB family radical SAM enzyme
LLTVYASPAEEEKEMKDNELFFAEMMKKVDTTFFAPAVFDYFRDYLSVEKVRRFGDRFVLNCFIPPFPSAAFDRFLAACFGAEGEVPAFSADFAVTNACVFNCYHCSNAGRVVHDLPTEVLKGAVREFQDLGTIVFNFTGGDPCLRHDLPEICAALRDDSCGIVSTTGYGFTDEMAERLRETGVYSIAISLDSPDEKEHDKKRGIKGAFAIALKGIETAKKWGFYNYTCAVPTAELLKEENFGKLIELNDELGVNELQLLEPAPAGRLFAGKAGFGPAEYEKEVAYMKQYNARDRGVAISSLANFESPEFFGCSAGVSHFYVDGAGEVSPCNFLPVSYGNIADEPVSNILSRMRADYDRPFSNCLAWTLHEYFKKHAKGDAPRRVDELPPVPLPGDEPLPRFFSVLAEIQQGAAGTEDTAAD